MRFQGDAVTAIFGNELWQDDVCILKVGDSATRVDKVCGVRARSPGLKDRLVWASAFAGTVSFLVLGRGEEEVEEQSSDL